MVGAREIAEALHTSLLLLEVRAEHLDTSLRVSVGAGRCLVRSLSIALLLRRGPRITLTLPCACAGVARLPSTTDRYLDKVYVFLQFAKLSAFPISFVL